MMKEYPILMNGEMVRAILDGTKTQTRRPMRLQPIKHFGCSEDIRRIETPWGLYYYDDIDFETYRPSYEVGDWLWVRETWTIDPNDLGYPEEIARDFVAYKADAPAGFDAHWGWVPSIHMPRWASRITLEVTEVRAQRIQEISENDAMSEGMWNGYTATVTPGEEDWHRRLFFDLWDSLYAKRGLGFDSNCWVWAYTFRRVSP
jgi:hypothetical protein